MPRIFLSWVSAVCSWLAAVGPSHFDGSACTVIFGNLLFMQLANASVRSRPLIDAVSPSSMTTEPDPLIDLPRN